MRIVNIAKRSRHQYEKEVLRGGEGHATVDAAMEACENEREVARVRKRARFKQMQDAREKFVADKAKQKETTELLKAERQRLAEARSDEKRQRKIEEATLHFDTAMFSNNVNHSATARKNRWAAFKRTFDLMPELDAADIANLERDWGKWDSAEHHRYQVGKPKNSEA
jgi:hypothetical protein